MKRVVLDASVALAWFLDDPVPAYATHMRQALLGGTRMLVPALWILEVANGLAVGERRGNLTAEQVARCLTLVEQLLGETIEVSSELIPLREVLATARTLRLTAYDSAYLETARNAALPLATLDRSLRAAATQAGVELAL